MGETWDGALRTLEPAGTLGMQAEPFLLLMWKLRPRGGRELIQDHVGVSLRVSPGDSGLPASNPVFCLFLLFHVRAFVGRGKGQGEGLGGMSPLGEARSCAGQHPSLGALRPGCASATLSVALLESLHTIWATARGGGTR